jgi:hypothetical protein
LFSSSLLSNNIHTLFDDLSSISGVHPSTAIDIVNLYSSFYASEAALRPYLGQYRPSRTCSRIVLGLLFNGSDLAWV